MTCEIVYGKNVTGDEFNELAAPRDYCGRVRERFPIIPKLDYPFDTSIAQKPVVFCYTKGQKCKAILSCIKWFTGRPGNFFAQHLVFEMEDDLVDAGPAWLVKRRGFYIDIAELDDWNARDKKITDDYDWQPPIIQPSDYCIGTGTDWGIHINTEIIKHISDTWNKEDGQKANAQFILLFDPKEHRDGVRLDLLYNLYARLGKDRRWVYQFCTFDSQRGGKEPLKWDIVFVANDDAKTQAYYKNKMYTSINLKGEKP